MGNKCNTLNTEAAAAVPSNIFGLMVYLASQVNIHCSSAERSNCNSTMRYDVAALTAYNGTHITFQQDFTDDYVRRLTEKMNVKSSLKSPSPLKLNAIFRCNTFSVNDFNLL